MKIVHLGIILVFVVLVGCTSPKENQDTPTGEAVAEQPAAETAEEVAEETIGGSVSDISLTANGFETAEVKVAKGSKITIINTAATMHKLNGGDLFRGQFNTYLKSIYGAADPLERNKLVVTVSEVGEYEIKDTTTNTILKIIAE